MKRILSIICALALLTLPLAAAPAKSKPAKQASPTTIRLSGVPADGPMGLGLFLGQPTGVSFELDLGPASWLDAKAAWNFGGGHGGYSILLQANYEYAFPGMLVIEAASFTPFFGLGAFFNLYDGGFGLGARAPGGLAYRFRKAPFELFIEVGLDIPMFPAFGIGASGGLGVRYRF